MSTGWLLQCKGLGCPSVFPSTGTRLSLGELRCHSIVPSLHGQRGCGEADTAACPLWGAQSLQHAPQGPLPAVPAIWGVGSLPGALPIMGMGTAAPAGPGGAEESSAGHQGPSPPLQGNHHSSQSPLHTWCWERCGAVFQFRAIIFDPILRLWVRKWALKAFLSQQCHGQSRLWEPHRGAGCFGRAQSRCFSFDPLKTRKV